MQGTASFRCCLAALLFLTLEATQAPAAPSTLNPNIQLRLILNTMDASGSASIRIAKDPRTNDLYYSKFNGDIYRVTLRPGNGTSTSTKVYGAANHGIADSAQGMAIGPDGTIYLVGNFTTDGGNRTFARIVKGVPGTAGERVWSVLAQTEPYPRSRTAFDHVFNGIIVSSDGNWLYVNSGSRTDHGEVQDVGGLFPNTREVGLTAKIFRLPANGSNLLLPNDANALRSAGYIFAEGTRNSFDFAFALNGDLFATENGPDRDMSEELNWLRPGLHFGFPWRIGGTDNPQQFSNYNPANDRLLDPRFIAVGRGYYHNDPSFPPRPANLAEPVINVGPDADKFRDPDTGSIKDASDLGLTLGTFTAHRSPLGLVFDTVGAMDFPFRNRGFMLSFTPGDPNGTGVPGPFFDASQDLVELECAKLGNTNYQARVTSLVGGFATPIDSEIIGNRIYVLEYSGQQGIWQITFPPTRTSVTLRTPAFQNGSFEFTVAGSIPGLQYEIQASTNLVHWTTVTNVIANSNAFKFRHASAVRFPHRFYRALQPSGSGLPAGGTNQDIGSVGIAGSTTYDQGVYTVNGSGNDIWNTADAFQFSYQTINGNGELIARVNSLQNTHAWAKAGVMFRQSTSANSANAFMMITAAQGTGFQWRSSAGAVSNYVPGPALAAPAWVRLTRQGDLFTGHTSTDGLSWTIAGSQTIPMSGSILAGIGVTSHNNTTLNTGTFQNVTFTAQP